MTKYPDLWAKSSKQVGQPGELLEEHTFRVVDGVVVLSRRGTGIETLVEEPRFWHQMVLSAGMHDLGKIASGFQKQLRSDELFGQRHEILSLAWLDWVCGDAEPLEHRNIAACVAAHHRDYLILMERYRPGLPHTPTLFIEQLMEHLSDSELEQGCELFLDAIVPYLQNTGLLAPDWKTPSLENRPSLDTAIASIKRALTTWQAWWNDLGSIRSTVQSKRVGHFVRGVLLIADHAGSAHVSLEQKVAIHSLQESSQRLAPPVGRSWYPHQQSASHTPGNVILVAPTGSGKTESAILWAAQQYEHAHRRTPLFYVLPFKASMNAMQSRLIRCFANDAAQLDSHDDSLVALQHSSALGVLYSRLMDRWDDPHKATTLARYQANLARLHAAPIRVLSPYQLLRAAFQLKGHEAIWTDAAGGIFVLDEIHAYEPARSAMILELVSYLVHQLGARVLVMTATMPPPIMQVIQHALGASNIIRASQETYDSFRRHRLRLLNTGLLDPQTIELIVERVRRGEAVLCVATMVKRAQELQAILQERLGPSTKVDLLHSRFTVADRSRKERRLAELVSTKLEGVRSQQVVLVATQVVEVSLDVDFDCLFSDPAPIECLVQRFGRVNRSRRPEPRDVYVCCVAEDATPVYDLQMVTRAIEALNGSRDQVIDERNVQTWLDQVYSDGIGERIAQQMKKACRNFARQLEELTPFESSEDLKERFSDMFDGYEVVPKSMLEDYKSALENNPLECGMFHIPISSGQLRSLRWKKALVDSQWLTDNGFGKFPPTFVDAPYDSEQGLQLDLDRTYENT